jgi:predicted RNA-binding Zn ribbon-like protein
VTDAPLVVALANAQAARRPAYSRTGVRRDALADAASASELLGPLLGVPVAARDLTAVRAAQRAIVAIVDAIADGRDPPVADLNELAAGEPAVFALEFDPDRRMHTALRAKRASATAALLVEVIGELGELEPSRLRRCARPECTLVFYDTTRSGTQRWHADNPCGRQQRQQRHRLRSAPAGEPSL